MKKHYNPLKMWGSYVGAIAPTIYVLLWAFSLGGFRIPILHQIFMIPYNIALHIPYRDITLASYPILFIYPIIGFIVGWGIHSFFRKIL